MIVFNPKIKLTVFIFTLLLVYPTQHISAQEKLLHFKDYPVTKIYKGRHAPLKIDPELKKLHGEEIELSNRDKVDFAGHYIVAGWSCGMWCNNSAVIDVKTGKLHFWDGILNVCLPDFDKDFKCNEGFSNIEYRRNSKLIIFFGFIFKNRKDETGKRGFHYYKFENGKFIHLKSVLVKEQREPLQMSIDEKTNNNGENSKINSGISNLHF